MPINLYICSPFFLSFSRRLWEYFFADFEKPTEGDKFCVKADEQPINTSSPPPLTQLTIFWNQNESNTSISFSWRSFKIYKSTNLWIWRMPTANKYLLSFPLTQLTIFYKRGNPNESEIRISCGKSFLSIKICEFGKCCEREGDLINSSK